MSGLIHRVKVNSKHGRISTPQAAPHSTIDRGWRVLISSLPIMGQQLRARAKRKRRSRQIQRKIDTAKAVVKTKAKK